jgi:hypothetical protein
MSGSDKTGPAALSLFGGAEARMARRRSGEFTLSAARVWWRESAAMVPEIPPCAY